jgi:hypothetical protein
MQVLDRLSGNVIPLEAGISNGRELIGAGLLEPARFFLEHPKFTFSWMAGASGVAFLSRTYALWRLPNWRERLILIARTFLRLARVGSYAGALLGISTVGGVVLCRLGHGRYYRSCVKPYGALCRVLGPEAATRQLRAAIKRGEVTINAPQLPLLCKEVIENGLYVDELTVKDTQIDESHYESLLSLVGTLHTENRQIALADLTELNLSGLRIEQIDALLDLEENRTIFLLRLHPNNQWARDRWQARRDKRYTEAAAVLEAFDFQRPGEHYAVLRRGLDDPARAVILLEESRRTHPGAKLALKLRWWELAQLMKPMEEGCLPIDRLQVTNLDDASGVQITILRDAIAKLPHLTDLNLDDNDLSQLNLADFLTHLNQQGKNIERLSLRNCQLQVTDLAVQQLCALPNLKTLDLSNNSVLDPTLLVLLMKHVSFVVYSLK